MFKCSPHYGPGNTVLLVERLERWEYTATNKSKNWMIVYLVNPIKLTYPGLERMHCQKSLKGPGTVLNGFPSKQAYKFYKTTMCEIQDIKIFTTKNQKNKCHKEASNAKIKFKSMTWELSIYIYILTFWPAPFKNE